MYSHVSEILALDFFFSILCAFVVVSGMISIACEQVLPLSQLAKRLPWRRGGRPVHPSTLHRWRQPGIRGIRLECIRLGGAWHSSVEALQRFAERLSRLESDGLAAPAEHAATDRVVDEGYQDRVERDLIDRGA
jgi:Protein of unknown function (DUF1580)